MTSKRKIRHRSPRRAAPAKPDTDKVGYRRPPKHSQFQPGRSGNPRGRPRGAFSLATHVHRVLGRRATVVERGERKSVPAAEAILLTDLASALKGDVKAGAFLLSLLERYQPAEAEQPAADVLSDQDREIVANFFKQVAKEKNRKKKKE